MKNIFRFIVGVLLIAGWLLAALSLHVVRTPGKLVVVPKNTLGISNTYVDTRAWTLDDVASHPQIVRRLIDAGKAHALEHVSDLKKDQDVQAQLIEAIRRGPTSKPAPSAQPTTQPAPAARVRTVTSNH